MKNGIGNNKQNNRQTRALVVHTYADNARYFYLHDRLGSVRQVINSSGSVVNFYTYEPFGKCFAKKAAYGRLSSLDDFEEPCGK